MVSQNKDFGTKHYVELACHKFYHYLKMIMSSFSIAQIVHLSQDGNFQQPRPFPEAEARSRHQHRASC